MAKRLVALVGFLSYILSACGDTGASPGTGGSAGTGGGAGTGGNAGSGGSPQACNPGADTFNAEIRGIIDQKCAKCHGETTDFGAPFSLLNHADLVAGAAPT